MSAWLNLRSDNLGITFLSDGDKEHNMFIKRWHISEYERWIRKIKRLNVHQSREYSFFSWDLQNLADFRLSVRISFGRDVQLVTTYKATINTVRSETVED